MGLKKAKGNPKFIDIIDTNKRVPYSFRIEERVLDKLHSISGNLDISTAELLTKIAKDYLADKTPYNNYLETYNRFIFDLPLNPDVKDILTGRLRDNDNINFKGFTDLDLAEEVQTIEYDMEYIINESDKEATASVKYQVLRVPNNLDTFSSKLETFTSSEKGLLHQGIEFLIVPEIAKYTENPIDCIYCFYFTVSNDKELEMELINFTDIENLIIEKGNKYLINLAETIYYNLERCNSIEEVEAVAELLNTDNIRPYANEPTEVNPFKVVLRDNTPVIRQYDKELERRVEKLEKQLKK